MSVLTLLNLLHPLRGRPARPRRVASRNLLAAAVAAAWAGAASAQAWPEGPLPPWPGTPVVQAERQVQATGRFDALPEIPLTLRNSSLPDSGRGVPLDPRAAAVARIGLGIDRDGVPADGQSTLRLTIRLFDSAGQPVPGVVDATLEISRGRVLAADRLDAIDADRLSPGRQVRVVDGVAHVHLAAPDVPGDADIRVSAGAHSVLGRVSFLPELRDMVAVGLVEGVIHLRHGGSGALLAARPSDGFEHEIRALARSMGDTAAARAAFFLKGRIKGQYLLTAAYDSDQDLRDRLFRDVRPDEYYPVYGDASLRGDDAPSTGRLFVRVDRGRSYALIGDFQTSSAQPGLQLGQYTRSATGVRLHHEERRLLLDAFVTRDTLKRVVDELPGRGISGPYFLTKRDGLANSETVELVTRDRNQPAVVLKRVMLTRLVDYDFEPLSGRLLLRMPVPTLDEQFNPVFLRVQYEVDQGGDRFWVGGVSGQVRPHDALELGGAYVEDRNPLARYRLASVNGTVRLGEGTLLSVEAARSDSAELITLGTLGQPQTATQPLGRGDAFRVELRHQGEGVDARLMHAQADPNFNNPAAPVSAGREESSAKLGLDLQPGLRVSAEALRSRDRLTGGRREGGYVGLEYGINPALRLDAGLRAVRETITPAQAASMSLQPYSPEASFFNPTGGLSVVTSAPVGSVLPGEVDQLSARARLTWSATDRLRLYGEAEQDLREASRRAAAVGGDWRFAERSRVYARHEFSNALSGIYGLNTGTLTHGSVLGLDTEYAKDAQLFSEYRLRDGGSGRDVQAAVGLRNLWTVAEGLRLSTSLENVRLVTQDKSGDAIAVALGLEYTANPLWKGSGRLEWRQAPTVTTTLSTLALARKLDRDWTLLARNVYNRTENSQTASGVQTQDRFQIGAAYRETDLNRVNALMRYEYRHEHDTQEADPYRREVHIASLHADHHPTRTLTTTGQLATKWVRERFGQVSSSFQAHLLAGRVIYDLTDRWDLGLNLALLTDRGMRSRQFSLGPEVGYLLSDNLWVSVGYNLRGFRDRDLVESDYTARGTYLRLRFKFDHRLWRGDDAAVNNSLGPAP